MIRDFMRVRFPQLIDGLFVLSAIGLCLSAIIYGGVAWAAGGFLAGFFTFIAVLFFGVLSLILMFGMIYVLLDMRDSLRNLETRG
jgi:hypothetical protein